MSEENSRSKDTVIEKLEKTSTPSNEKYVKIENEHAKVLVVSNDENDTTAHLNALAQSSFDKANEKSRVRYMG